MRVAFAEESNFAWRWLIRGAGCTDEDDVQWWDGAERFLTALSKYKVGPGGAAYCLSQVQPSSDPSRSSIFADPTDVHVDGLRANVLRQEGHVVDGLSRDGVEEVNAGDVD